jgi:hypothetical protein
MSYQIGIEVYLFAYDKELLNATYEYVERTCQSDDEDVAIAVNGFKQSIYKMIAVRHGLNIKTLHGLHGKPSGDYLDFQMDIGRSEIPEKNPPVPVPNKSEFPF